MKDQAPIILRKTRFGFEAMDAIDAETLAQYAFGSEVEVTFRKRRSGPQQRLYWKVLGEVVKATDKWPSATHLHDDLKISLGYWQKLVTMSGQVTYRADSTAFPKMDGQEFKVFFDRAMKLIAETVGFDPLASYEALKVA
jgi:hypothetical protein